MSKMRECKPLRARRVRLLRRLLRWRLLRLPRPKQPVEALANFTGQEAFATHAAFEMAADDVLHGAGRVLLHDVRDELAQVQPLVEGALNRKLQRLPFQRSEQPLASAKQIFGQ